MSIFPINWQDKENSPQLLAFLQQFGEKAYLSAEEINQIRDALNYLSNLTGVGSGITNDSGFAFVGTDFVINALFSWKFNGVDYVLDDALSIPVPYTAAGKHRTDVIVARNGSIIKLTGLEYNIDVPAPAPTYNQITDLFITDFEVKESGYGTALPALVGSDFLKKTFLQPFAYTGTGEHAIIPLDPLGREEIRLTNASLVSVGGFDLSLITGNPSAEVPFLGKRYRLKNLTGADVTILNDYMTPDIIFYARDLEDVVIPNGHELELIYAGGVFYEGLRSWSAGGASGIQLIYKQTTDQPLYVIDTSAVILYSYLIPANTFSVGDVVRCKAITKKGGGTTSGFNSFIYVNSSNSLSFAKNIGYVNTGTTNRQAGLIDRQLTIKPSYTEVMRFDINAAYDFATVNPLGLSQQVIDWTIDQYFIIAATSVFAGSGEELQLTYFELTKL